MSRLTISTAFALLLGFAFGVQAINPNAGTTGFNFLKIGVGARASALGGAYSTVSGDVEATSWNPAGLYGIKHRSAVLSLNKYLVNSQAGFASIAIPSINGPWAISANYVTYGKMRRTDIEGRDLGSFSASDIAIYTTFTRAFKNRRIIVGTNFKMVYSSIDTYNSDAYAIDLGFQLVGPVKGMRIGASLSNVGIVRSPYAGDSKDQLPVHIRVGISHTPVHMPMPMLLALDLNVPNDNDAYFSFGMEMELVSGLFIRPGYSLQQTGSTGEDPLGLSAGTGIQHEQYRIDYSYSSFVDLGETHRISLTGHF